jgi:hypothetical protein
MLALVVPFLPHEYPDNMNGTFALPVSPRQQNRTIHLCNLADHRHDGFQAELRPNDFGAGHVLWPCRTSSLVSHHIQWWKTLTEMELPSYTHFNRKLVFILKRQKAVMVPEAPSSV